jgi:hypothetical protein
VDLLNGMSADALGVTVAAGLTLMVYSYLLGDTFLFRVAEYLFVGVTVAYSAVVAVRSVLLPQLIMPLATAPAENLGLLAPAFLCALLFANLVPRLRPLSSIPLAIVVGVGTGLALGGALVGIIVPQVAATILPIHPLLPLAKMLDNAIIVVGTVCTLLYFAFTARGESPANRLIRGAGSVGRWFMLIAFGAVIGNVVMSRLSLLIGRVQFLLEDWLHLIQ